MLNGISKVLTGDMLKALCDMGHGDTLVLADANFPAETYAKRLIRCSGCNASELLEAILPLFPIDVDYTEQPAAVMELTASDRNRKMPRPEAWDSYESILQGEYSDLRLGMMERFAFYEKTKEAFLVIQTGEERQYGNLMLVKGVVK